METLIGKVWVNEDMSDGCRDYIEISNIEDFNDRLEYRLADYIGKTVKVTVKIIEPNCRLTEN